MSTEFLVTTTAAAVALLLLRVIARVHELIVV